MPDQKLTRKMLGDAGEHFVLSQIMFSGMPCSKMPDGWKHYDLVADRGDRIERISVKTRSHTKSFSESSWFIIKDPTKIDWLACVLYEDKGPRVWVLPVNEVSSYTETSSGAIRLSVHILKRDFLVYEGNWSLECFPAGRIG